MSTRPRSGTPVVQPMDVREAPGHEREHYRRSTTTWPDSGAALPDLLRDTTAQIRVRATARGDVAALDRHRGPDQLLTGLVSGVTVAAMICAGLLSVILFLLLALSLLRRNQ